MKLLVRPLNCAFCPSSNAGPLGININPQPGLIKWESGQGNIDQVCHHITLLTSIWKMLDSLCSNSVRLVPNVNVEQRVYPLLLSWSSRNWEAISMLPSNSKSILFILSITRIWHENLTYQFWRCRGNHWLSWHCKHIKFCCRKALSHSAWSRRSANVQSRNIILV